MSDILGQIAAQLGLSPAQAQAGAGSVFQLIRESAAKVDFDQLLQAVPQASSWMKKAAGVQAAPAATPLGGLGDLLGRATEMFGGGGGAGGLGGLGQVISVLTKAGIDPDTAAKFLPMLLQFLQSKAGADLLARLSQSVPFLKELQGGAGGVNLSDGLDLSDLGGLLGKFMK
jgi:hypothetical protein